VVGLGAGSSVYSFTVRALRWRRIECSPAPRSHHSDLTLYLAHKTLRSWLPGASISSSISFFDIRNASFSGGSLASMLSIADLPREQTRVGEYGLTCE
jgi:hypothetical protein